MFKKSEFTPPATVTVVLDNKEVSLPKETSVAAGLMGMGEMVSRVSPSSGKACAPHCLMGVCCECMMEIDGVRRQACMTHPREGMVISRGLDALTPEKEEDDHGPSL